MFDVTFSFGTHICLLCTYKSPLTEGVRVADGALYEALQAAGPLNNDARKVQSFSLTGGGVLLTPIPTEEKRKHGKAEGESFIWIPGNLQEKKNRTKTRGCKIKTDLPLSLSSSKWRTEQAAHQRGGVWIKAPRDTGAKATPFSDTLLFSPTKNSELGPTEAVSGVRYFLWNKQHCSTSANRAWLPEGSSI